MSGAGPTTVLGGGLAGIAAAVRLAEAGEPVTLVETRKRLGGRATSHVDPGTGELIDNCQHVLLGCCTNLVDLYRRLGVEDAVGWHRSLHFFDKGVARGAADGEGEGSSGAADRRGGVPSGKPGGRGRHWVMRGDPLPAPAHLSRSMLGYRGLSMGDRLGVARAMSVIMRAGESGRGDVSGITFGDWLRQQGQSEAAIERFWSVIVISALNADVDRLSAAYAFQVFQDGFLAHRRAYVMGVPKVSLASLYDAAGLVIERAGGAVRTGASVRALGFDEGAGRVSRVELADGTVLEPGMVISALPFDRLAKVAPEGLRAADDRLGRLEAIEVSPIVGIHLWFDRPVVRWPHMIFVDSPLQWAFVHGHAGEGQHVHGVISAADAWVGRSDEAILEMARAELARYPTVAGEAALVRGRVIREKRATFAPVPGVDALRPTTRGAVQNLLLAGDWVATGWPATMEGAVRSGYRAAGAALGREQFVRDLPKAPLYRLLSG